MKTFGLILTHLTAAIAGAGVIFLLFAAAMTQSFEVPTRFGTALCIITDPKK